MAILESITEHWAQRLKERRVVTLATENTDGSLYTYTAWYIYEDDTVYFAVQEGEGIAENVRVRKRLAFTLYVGEHNNQEALMINGTGDIIEGDQAQAINHRLHQRYLTDEALTDPAVAPILEFGNNQTIKVNIQTIETWGLKDLDDFFDGRLAANNYIRPLKYD